MFHEFEQMQFSQYKKSLDFFENHPENLIAVERFLMEEIKHFVNLHLPEIKRDYDEASYLHPFWKNYPPLNRGRSPKGDQFPWIEVGEQVFDNKLQRYFAANFDVKDAGLPSGADDRCIISSEKIRQILEITNSIWVFVDIKSAGPRDNYEHAVMSPYQISGSGDWQNAKSGMKNKPILAKGERAVHEFPCSLSPIYITSDEIIAPLATFVIKPIYEMLDTGGQPLKSIKIASIPNGVLLTRNPNYTEQFRGLFFPGKDDKKKDLRKIRARIDFEILRKIASWRICEIDAATGAENEP